MVKCLSNMQCKPGAQANVKRQIFPPTQTGRYEIGSVDYSEEEWFLKIYI